MKDLLVNTIYQIRDKSIMFSLDILGERVDNLIFRGQSLLADGENRITVGVISEPDRRTRTVQEYVGVDEAKLDLATGIYNKKTVTDMITSSPK